MRLMLVEARQQWEEIGAVLEGQLKKIKTDAIQKVAKDKLYML